MKLAALQEGFMTEMHVDCILKGAIEGVLVKDSRQEKKSPGVHDACGTFFDQWASL